MILFGASGHAKVILDILFLNRVSVEKIIDDHPSFEELFKIPVEKNTADFEGLEAIISIGNNGIRKSIAEKYSLHYQKAIHPKSTISQFSEIGEGTVVMAGAVINADAIIGNHCIVNTGATVDHDCVVEDYCHVAPGVHISGGTHVGEGTWIGVGSSVIQCLNIGKNCMIGAGSVVVKDVPDNVTALGCPAKVIKIISK